MVTVQFIALFKQIMHATLQRGRVHWFWYWLCPLPCVSYDIRMVDYNQPTQAYPHVPVFGNRRLGYAQEFRFQPVLDG